MKPTLDLVGLSPRFRYTLRALVYLAKQPPGVFSLAEDAAAAEKLPPDFLAKLMQELARHGLLNSRRGPGGGYALSVDPSAITLSSVIRMMKLQEVGPDTPCFLEHRRCNASHPCALHHEVLAANARLTEALDKMTLKELLRYETPWTDGPVGQP